nr:MAG TPA: hypothetical protein [Caudoviricetes sp.]
MIVKLRAACRLRKRLAKDIVAVARKRIKLRRDSLKPCTKVAHQVNIFSAFLIKCVFHIIKYFIICYFQNQHSPALLFR